MKKNIYLFIITIIVLILKLVYSNENPNKLFNEIIENYNQKNPKDFIASLNGKILNFYLYKIPPQYICNNNSKIDIKIIALKGIVEKIVIENIEQPFASSLERYLIYQNIIKSFLNYKNNFKEFIKIFEWKILKSSEKEYSIKLRKLKSKKSNYINLFFNKQDLKLEKIVNIKNSKYNWEIKISYKKSIKYKLISSMRFKNKDNYKFTIYINNYLLNTGISKQDLINTQNDCPRIIDYLDRSNIK